MGQFEHRFTYTVALGIGAFIGLIIGLMWGKTSGDGQHPFFDVPQFWAGALAVVAATIGARALNKQIQSNEKLKEDEIEANKQLQTDQRIHEKNIMANSIRAEIHNNLIHSDMLKDNSTKFIVRILFPQPNNMREDITFHQGIFETFKDRIGLFDKETAQSVLKFYMTLQHTIKCAPNDIKILMNNEKTIFQDKTSGKVKYTQDFKNCKKYYKAEFKYISELAAHAISNINKIDNTEDEDIVNRNL